MAAPSPVRVQESFLRRLFKTLAFFWTLWYIFTALSSGTMIGVVFILGALFVPWLIVSAILLVLAWAS